MLKLIILNFRSFSLIIQAQNMRKILKIDENCWCQSKGESVELILINQNILPIL